MVTNKTFAAGITRQVLGAIIHNPNRITAVPLEEPVADHRRGIKPVDGRLPFDVDPLRVRVARWQKETILLACIFNHLPTRESSRGISVATLTCADPNPQWT
jgi:hypothetical protein